MTPPITLYQRHRLLDEVTQRPGQSTQQLAALISVNYKVAYRALRRHALAGLVYSISIGGMGVMQQASRWWPCGVEATLEDISARFAPRKPKQKPANALSGITEADLYYHRYWKLPKEQRATMPFPEACRD
ncbi:hypothetical protein BN873_890043 [Candidatus Competibacter denitrificans Run_A_D11]|uniref:Uncharacterized protein n=1 Tax=Candidatus Competibacter denitrificans Run_A_D11 TaxID=1400863 RepID=W6M9B3_9GAMM|nr:hypothetical protein [Candidatus Competibacter denitrificans]CDI04137.1 hypothetical protein BN873_890043 [Candidatus Competibacter denitrificans Run_A_D11]HAS86213.1 hypothetical protein [Candidatus Competibacteraceae bacterium]HRC69989.1 hypothetical protein [Candidatus Competibacter denitrificans]